MRSRSAALLVVLSVACGDAESGKPAPEQPAPTLPTCPNEFGDLADGDKEAIDGVEVTHRFRLASGICWHYVEAGRGEPIAFVHGFPESWWSWHGQLSRLADGFRVFAIDMKAYGQTGKPDGDYRIATVAEETFGLIGGLGYQKIDVVGHDWGSIITERMCCTHPERISRFIRLEAPLMVVNLANAPQLHLFKDQEFARSLMLNPEALMDLAYGRLTLEPLPAEVLARIADEFRYPGIADMVPKYFRDLELNPSAEQSADRRACLGNMPFPVLLLQADSDPNQPLEYYDGAVELFQDAELRWVSRSGHFSELEQPEQVSAEIRAFRR